MIHACILIQPLLTLILACGAIWLASEICAQIDEVEAQSEGY